MICAVDVTVARAHGDGSLRMGVMEIGQAAHIDR
jgi:hypothetical protein